MLKFGNLVLQVDDAFLFLLYKTLTSHPRSFIFSVLTLAVIVAYMVVFSVVDTAFGVAGYCQVSGLVLH